MQTIINEKPEYNYTNFWVRAAALLIDMIILGILFKLINLLFGLFLPLNLGLENFTSDDGELVFQGFFNWSILTFIVLKITAFWLYYALMESRLGATVGKYILNIRVTDENCAFLSFKKASGHAFARLLSIIPFLTGYLMALFTEKNQTLHDLLIDCIVIPKYQVTHHQIFSEDVTASQEINNL
ncbi:MAG: RDD family protein [Bacteroidetes bacterium]|nr:RDD family protein [Bacteroidota bacterium]